MIDPLMNYCIDVTQQQLTTKESRQIQAYTVLIRNPLHKQKYIFTLIYHEQYWQ